MSKAALTHAPDSPWPHRLAMLLVCATFPLIGIGSLVTTYSAGMAVPDWPSTYGYNLFLYPWQTWVFGPFDLLVEHGHRLFAALVGLLTIALTVVTCRQDPRQWVRVLSIVALVLVIAQGALGGARVLLNERTLALVHGCTAPVFFAVCISLAAVTSRYWRQSDQTLDSPGEEDAAGDRLGRLARLATLTTVFAYVQLVLGAQVRHISVQAKPSFFQVVVFAHLAMALVLLLHVAFLCYRAWRCRLRVRVRRVAVSLALATLFQIGLGAATWVMKYGYPDGFADWRLTAGHLLQAQGFSAALMTTLHVLNGSLMLGLSLLMTLRSFRVMGVSTAQVSRSSPRDEAVPSDSLRMGVVV